MEQWPHLNITFGGTYWGDEKWQCGIKMAFSILDDDETMKAFAAARISQVDTAIATWLANVNCGVSRKALYQWVKVNAVRDGKYIDQAHTNMITRGSAVTPAAFPGANSTELPPQVCLCVSLVTSLASRGKASHGRVFLPVQSIPLQSSSYRINTTALQSIADCFKGFLDDLNAWASPPAHPPLVSLIPRTGMLSNSVTSVKVGDCYDVHRSRDKDLKENYYSATLA